MQAKNSPAGPVAVSPARSTCEPMLTGLSAAEWRFLLNGEWADPRNVPAQNVSRGFERRVQAIRILCRPLKDETGIVYHYAGEWAHALIEQYPCPPPTHRAAQQKRVPLTLRGWVKSQKQSRNDPNLACKSRYNVHLYCSGVILPASQTAAVWQMSLPRVLAPDEGPTLTLGTTRADVQEQIERGRQDLNRERQTYILAEHDEKKRDWEKELENCGMPSELSPVVIERRSNSFAAETKKRAKQDAHDEQREQISLALSRFLHSDDEESDAGFGTDGISYDGLRETTKHEDLAVVRKKQARYLNPKNLTRAEGEQSVLNHPDFESLADRWNLLITNKRILRPGDSQTKFNVRIYRSKERMHKTQSEFPKFDQVINRMTEDEVHRTVCQGGWFCVVVLNNQPYLKHLAPFGLEFKDQAEKTFVAEWEKSQKNAVKQARKEAKGLGQAVKERMIHAAIEKIGKAYDEVKNFHLCHPCIQEATASQEKDCVEVGVQM